MHTLRDTINAFKQKKMIFLFLLGMSSGLPLALTWGTMQAWMTEVDVNLKTIGLFAFLRIPFSLKFLWAPIMDRYRIPFLDRRRGWVLLTQALVALALLGVSWTDPKGQAQQLMIIVLLCNFFAASQDIVLDAYRRDILTDAELGIGSALFVDGYLLAFRFISGAGAILLSKFISWPQVYQVMALLMILMALPVFASPSCEEDEMGIPKKVEGPSSLIVAFVDPLKDYFSKPGALTIFAFIILYKLGDNIALNMTIPFILKNGFSKEEYVAIAKVWGLGATLFGGLLGGICVYRIGIFRSLFVMGVLQALANMGFLMLSNTVHNIPLLVGVLGFENLAVGMGTAAQSAFMASITNKKYSATQFALLSSLMAIPGIVFASRAGTMAEAMGWPLFFISCAALSIPGLFLLPFLHRMTEERSIPAFAEWIRKSLVLATMVGAVYATIKSIAELIQLNSH